MNMSRRMTTKEAITRFHKTHILADAEAWLERAEMYKRCKKIPANVRGALFSCRIARMYDHNREFKRRSAALIRALIKDLSDEDIDCVERSLFVYMNTPFDLEYAPFPSNLRDAPEEFKQAVRDWAVERASNPGVTVTAPRKGKPMPAVIHLEGHGRMIDYGGFSHSLPPELWGACLSAARAFGWSRQGTGAPAGYQGDWDGSYHSGKNQLVKYDDARKLRFALERMIEAVRSRKEMTVDQLDAVEKIKSLDRSLSGAREVADFTLDGAFVIRQP